MNSTTSPWDQRPQRSQHRESPHVNENDYEQIRQTPEPSASQQKRIDSGKRKILDACAKRGVCGIKKIGRMFRLFANSERRADRSRDSKGKDGTQLISFDEWREGLSNYGVTIGKDECQAVFDAVDTSGDGAVDMNELLRFIRPQLSKPRTVLIDLAFAKLDVSGDGIATVEDLASKYDARHHPKFQSGELSAKQVTTQFLVVFEPEEDTRDGMVTKDEFLEYYIGVSNTIDKDVYFDFMMRKAWKL